MDLLTASQPDASLLSLLQDAEEGNERILATLSNTANTTYLARKDDVVVGAAVVCWQQTESEIIYIAVGEPYRGRGYGKALIACLVAEARRRGVHSLIVGTANASLENIAFYQKCGFRMDSVRRDYFAYFREPVYANGIRIQDMLMLKIVL